MTFLIEDHRWVHAFGVPVEVATFLEERRLGEVRRVNEFISLFFVANARVILHLTTNDAALGMENRQT